MSFSARYVPAVLLTLIGLAVTLPAQTTNTQGAKAPRGSVSGRVTIKDKGAGGVAVSLRKTEMNPYEPYVKATTDHDGFYRIANVPPGSYEVAPSAPAYVPADSQRGGKTVVVGEDENVEDINFALVRGGVITGKVKDADGRAVILQQVNLFGANAFTQRQQTSTGQQPVFPVTNVQTDDRGIYRIYGLRAGRYKVAVGRSDETFNTGSIQQRGGYKQVFHPDVTDQAKATIIEVTEGSEANDVDITLGAALQTFSASGRLVDSEKGLPIPNLAFSFQRLAGQRAEITNLPVTSNSQGEFVAEGLVPGRYQVFLYQDMNRTDLRVDPFTFEVVDQDVSNIVIKLSKGASLSGVVVIESEDKTALQKLTQMRLRAYPVGTAGGTGIVGSSSTIVAADGSFRLGGLPGGTINVQLSGAAGPFDLKGYTVSRIERDGVPMPRGIEVKDGEQVAGIRVVVAYGNGSIRGVVKMENGSLPAGVQMSVRLVKPGQSLFIRPSQVDARGSFLMEGIPPGNYELVLQFFGAGAPQQPPGNKREVSIQNGVVTDVMFTVDLTTQPRP